MDTVEGGAESVLVDLLEELCAAQPQNSEKRAESEAQFLVLCRDNTETNGKKVLIVIITAATCSENNAKAKHGTTFYNCEDCDDFFFNLKSFRRHWDSGRRHQLRTLHQ